MALLALRWIAFVWGCLALGVMAYYALRWFPHARDIRYNEMALGFMLGAFYGWPSWLTLPIFAVAQRNSLPRWQFWLLLMPPAFAILLFAVGHVLARGGL